MSSDELSPAARAVLAEFKDSLPFYCKQNLKIVDVSGKLVPLEFNRAQQYLHEQLEEQKRKTGMVRALVLKGRKQGVSTYTEARYYHASQFNSNLGVFILSHHSKTTDEIFRMASRFHNGVPEVLRVETRIDNQRRMEFTNNSCYEVGTARSGEVGRGFTIHRFHGSEVASFENADEVRSGILQAIADAEGTEIILESTAKGMGNMFHQMCIDALEGRSNFILVFIPWYWDTRYVAQVPDDFVHLPEELQLVDLYGLSPEQLVWRRNKIASLGSEKLFRQEYPNTPHEAFITSSESLIDNELVDAAQKNTKTDQYAPRILGVDPARSGGDRTAMIWRQGRHVYDMRAYDTMDTNQLSGIIANILIKNEVDHVFMDVAYGYGALDRLRELGFGSKVTGVTFGSKAADASVYLNKRAEMAGAMRDWFENEDPNIPNSIELAMDIAVIPDFVPTSNGKKKLVSKDEIRKQFGKSTDFADALMVTFAYPVARREISNSIFGDEIPQYSKTVTSTRKRISDIMKR